MKDNSQVSTLSYCVVLHSGIVDTGEESLGDYQQVQNREKIGRRKSNIG